MALSMTGYGDGHAQSETMRFSVEIRSVNNRHFKLSLRLPTGLEALEPDVERKLRDITSRGTLQVTVRLEAHGRDTGPRLRTDVLAGYWRQLEDGLRGVAPLPETVAPLLTLPGVVESQGPSSESPESFRPLLFAALDAALEQFAAFRRQEGAAMAGELHHLIRQMRTRLSDVQQHAPLVVKEYHEKLRGRVAELVRESGASLQPEDFAREVAMFADRCDITEELVRLVSHFDQFEQLLDEPAQGRKLDFLCQELFREANTIGSKANSLLITRAAVDLKTLIERVREVVQNLE